MSHKAKPTHAHRSYTNENYIEQKAYEELDDSDDDDDFEDAARRGSQRDGGGGGALGRRGGGATATRPARKRARTTSHKQTGSDDDDDLSSASDPPSEEDSDGSDQEVSGDDDGGGGGKHRQGAGGSGSGAARGRGKGRGRSGTAGGGGGGRLSMQGGRGRGRGRALGVAANAGGEGAGRGSSSDSDVIIIDSDSEEDDGRGPGGGGGGGTQPPRGGRGRGGGGVRGRGGGAAAAGPSSAPPSSQQPTRGRGGGGRHRNPGQGDADDDDLDDPAAAGGDSGSGSTPQRRRAYVVPAVPLDINSEELARMRRLMKRYRDEWEAAKEKCGVWNDLSEADKESLAGSVLRYMLFSARAKPCHPVPRAKLKDAVKAAVGNHKHYKKMGSVWLPWARHKAISTLGYDIAEVVRPRGGGGDAEGPAVSAPAAAVADGGGEGAQYFVLRTALPTALRCELIDGGEEGTQPEEAFKMLVLALVLQNSGRMQEDELHRYLVLTGFPPDRGQPHPLLGFFDDLIKKMGEQRYLTPEKQAQPDGSATHLLTWGEAAYSEMTKEQLKNALEPFFLATENQEQEEQKEGEEEEGEEEL